MDIFFAVIACSILLGLAIFQILLVLGKPYGEYAWGGYHKVLPLRLRVASAVSVLLYVYICLIILQSAEIINVFNGNYINIVTLYFAVGIFINLASRSKKERKVMAPLCGVLFLCCLFL